MINDAAENSSYRAAIAWFKGDKDTSWLFVLPALLLSLSIIAFPVAATLFLSFTDWNGLGVPHFIGLENFRALFAEARFWKAVSNNLIFTTIFVTAPMVIALVAAALLLIISVGRTFFQVVFFLPVTIATIILAEIWRGMIYSPVTGVIGWLQSVGIPVSNPLGDPATSLYGVLLVDVWHWWGYLTIIYFAALRQVDTSLIEAAVVDGASYPATFRYVLLPMILPTILFMLLMSIIWSFRVFDWIYILTEGGPGFSSEVLGTLAYKTAFQQMAVGKASAYSLVMSMLGLMAIAVYLRIQYKSEKAA
jgi:raffinose/stachyose/melibiose transport system permease protein